ncbi:MCE family protein [[Mycobacterium] vasticus]|uniref:MCE family protein n=1 Tax=[Mycobacterium] vasticus TaxID=2875777 RepID=A0ABU5Z2P1_9MYCO|nr:MCE family protein [Mycolicibacter sp. MYC017]MEB3071667.1 MCE family protein [Mycolicibacter sp. MYC017]
MANIRVRVVLAISLVAMIVVGAVVVAVVGLGVSRTHITAYFANSNGLFTGDEVRLLGVAVGQVEKIEPQPERVKVNFWVDSKYPVPAEANAVILSPSLVTSRAIQLTPVYTSGQRMQDGAVIPQERTAVPVEWDDFRRQLEKLTTSLQPDQPGGVSSLGAFVKTTADNLRGNGGDIRDAIIKMSQAFSAMGDHSDDLFSSVKNLSIVVSALQDSTDVVRTLNQNLAAVTGLLSDDHGEVGRAVADMNDVVGDVASFIADNRETLGVTFDKLAGVNAAINEIYDDLEQSLHMFPTMAVNYVNVFETPLQSITGAIALTNFANPISFLCGAIQATSRLGAEQAAKLCVQYLAPIIKNRAYTFLPIGGNPIIGAQARPNEVTYSEDWLKPNYVPPSAPDTGTAPSPAAATPIPPPDEPQSTDPAAGLPGLMVPTGDR